MRSFSCVAHMLRPSHRRSIPKGSRERIRCRARVHLGRTFGRHRDHRRPGGAVASGRAGSARSGTSGFVYQQSEKRRRGDAQLFKCAARVSAGPKRLCGHDWQFNRSSLQLPASPRHGRWLEWLRHDAALLGRSANLRYGPYRAGRSLQLVAESRLGVRPRESGNGQNSARDFGVPIEPGAAHLRRMCWTPRFRCD